MATAVPAEQHQRSRMHLFPQTPLGWWGLGLMLAAAMCPAYWAILTPLIKSHDPEAHARTALTIGVALPSIAVGVAALIRPRARSILLLVISTVVAIEIAWLVWFLVSF